MNNRESLIKLIDRLSDKAVERVRRLAEYLYIHKNEVRCGADEELEERQRLISAINGILHATDSLWVLNQILRCASNITKEDSKQ